VDTEQCLRALSAGFDARRAKAFRDEHVVAREVE
jgi:hypothetical protein